ncbi:TIGR02281 family clan AA aspartic protease [Methylobacterium sp.]|uniref:retropepsin-like aspartic protease family protein n=1 Tax=Methylobacterium sp. TaxID=409 RepID=UPI0025F4A168|nr:TIGR02281 family clan AA aspartic protease [Methylobacterium sp.]
MEASQPSGTLPNTLVLEANAQGHFLTEVTVDGSRLSMLVDTGATLCAFSQEDAERAGIRVSERDFTARTQTANGVVAVAPVRIPVIRIGTITVRDVEAVVVPRGRLSTSLLGMSFLRRLSDVGMARGRLTLRG